MMVIEHYSFWLNTPIVNLLFGDENTYLGKDTYLINASTHINSAAITTDCDARNFHIPVRLLRIFVPE